MVLKWTDLIRQRWMERTKTVTFGTAGSYWSEAESISESTSCSGVLIFDDLCTAAQLLLLDLLGSSQVPTARGQVPRGKICHDGNAGADPDIRGITQRRPPQSVQSSPMESVTLHVYCAAFGKQKPPKSSKFIQILHILLHLEHLQGSNLIQLGWREMREHCNVRLVWTCTPVCQCDLLGRLAAGGLGRGWMPDVISGVHWKYPDHILKWH